MAGSKKTSASSKNSGNGQNQDPSEGNLDLGATVSEASEQIQDQVSGLTQQVRQQATEQFETQKDRLVDTLDTVALLLHQAGEHADLQDKATLSGYVNKASGQLNQWSETLREREATQLLDDAVQFARRQPMLFFSGALAAGFAGARFFRSSTAQPEEHTESAPAVDVESTTTEAPHFETIQEAFESASTIDDMPLEQGMTSQGAWDQDAGGVMVDDMAAGLEGDELIDGSLAGTNDSTSTENR